MGFALWVAAPLLLCHTAMAFMPAAHPMQLRSGGIRIRMSSGESDSISPVCDRSQALRKISAVALSLLVVSPSTRARAEEGSAEAAPAEEGTDDQILSVDSVNPKKLGILGGAFIAADLISGALTGRSVLRILNGKEDPEDWKTKAVNKLLEKEKLKNAEKMGVSVTTNTQPAKGPSATGEYAKKDPFEIAKQRYKKPESIEDMNRALKKKLQESLDDDK